MASDYEQEGLLHDNFQRQARETPEAVAVVSTTEDRSATFAELDQWSSLLAAALQQRGAAPDRCVAICLDKGMDFVVSYIAVLKAGAAYLPLDTAYPSHMIEAVLEDALPVVVITAPEFESKLKSALDKMKTLVLKPGWAEVMAKQASPKLVTPEVHMDNLAYIVYSSGTTGKPKGIQCPHRGAVFSYHNRHVQYPYQPGDREACNIFFVWEMLRPLLRGVPMYPIPNSVIYDPPLLCQHVQTNAITRMLFTPSLLETLLNSRDLDIPAAFRSMRQIWFCGEVVTTSLLERCVAALPWVRFVNLYSISECHDVACLDLTEYYEKNKESLTARKFCPVGKILQGVHVAILGEDGKPLPVGCTGEIYVGGPTLARGYINRPEQQAQRFISRPEGVPAYYGERLYRTGDCGYMLSDGCLEIHGRIDSMVKIRGYSIEVQAVESALLLLPMVQAAVVLVRGEEGEDKFLVAYIVKRRPTNKKEIRGELKLRLPFYMIPSYIVFLDSIPVVASTGKLDKAALPPFDRGHTEEVEAEGRPSTALEVQLARIWADVLRVQNVDIHESFFDMGGHSLLATELQRRVKETFGVSMPVKDLFTYPTVSLLSQYIEAAQTHSGAESTGIRLAAPPELDLAAEVEKHDQVVMDLDIQLRAFWRIFLHKHHFRKGRVLLTGATGFLGAFLLKEMLLHSKLLVYCLVRELPGQDPLVRVRRTLVQYEVLPGPDSRPTEEQTALENLLNKRVIAMKGNVALMKLGMSDDDYNYLSTDTDFIIHAAAHVNLAYPYSALHGANVLGTQNIILFASTGKVKPIHYISTNGVFPHGLKDCAEDADVTLHWQRLTDGYSQSKWVAEQLVARAGQRGLPVTIYRLGNLGGDRQNATWNPQDFTLLLLAACARYSAAPAVEWAVEMTPVDFVAQVIVRLVQQPDHTIGKTLHVLNDRPLPAKWIFKWMNANGYSLSEMPFQNWRKKVLTLLEESEKNNETSAGNELARILESYITDETSLSELSSFKTDNFTSILKSLGLEYPYTDARLLQTYFRRLSAKNLLPRQRRNTVSKPLSERVAIVTGASSGIGAAISVALAAAGARVAMAARREDQLRELEKRISDDGGVAISVKTDVLDRKQVEDLVKQTQMALGEVDILVNSAGVMYYTLMENVHQDEWDRIIDVNCKGVTNCVAAVIAGMVKRESGHIINISSDAGRKGFPGLAVYSGSKFFVEGLSQAMRSELADKGVKVTSIQPGDTSTPIFGFSTDREAVERYDINQKHPCLDPTDVARAVVYAASVPDYVAVNEILVQPRDSPL